MIFTKKFMRENRGCYSLEQLEACSFMKRETITAESILESEIPDNDKVWFFFVKVFVIDEELRKKFYAIRREFTGGFYMSDWDNVFLLKKVVKNMNVTYDGKITNVMGLKLKTK